eukprot:s1789_g5.t1
MASYTLPQDCTIPICFHLSKSIKLPGSFTLSSCSQVEVQQFCKQRFPFHLRQPTVAGSARSAFISHVSICEKNAAGKALQLAHLNPHGFLMCTIFARTQLWGKLLNAVEWVEAMSTFSSDCVFFARAASN